MANKFEDTVIAGYLRTAEAKGLRTERPTLTIQEAARKAVDVQNACNLSGVAESLVRDILPAVRADVHAKGGGTSEINGHPVIRAFVDKLASLARVQAFGSDWDKAGDAHAWCERESACLRAGVVPFGS